jgi:hypothetical protein
MRVRTVAIGALLFLALSAVYGAVAEIVFDDCGLSEDQAKKTVLEELARLRLDPKYLSRSTSQTGSCAYSFDFEGQGQKLNYIVASTWLHGVKLNSWDYKREALDDAGPVLQRRPDGSEQRR